MAGCDKSRRQGLFLIDELLRQVAEWLRQTVGDPDLVTRFGADHFAVALPGARNEDEIGRLVEKSLDAFINHPFKLGEGIFRIAAKVGIAVFPHDGNDAATLVKHAEVALKKAKVGGDRYLSGARPEAQSGCRGCRDSGAATDAEFARLR